jgi:hypothetical protein
MEGGSRTRREGNEDGVNTVCGGGCGESRGGGGLCSWAATYVTVCA